MLNSDEFYAACADWFLAAFLALGAAFVLAAALTPGATAALLE